MAKLFILPDPRLRSIIVKGDLIISEANRDSPFPFSSGLARCAREKGLMKNSNYDEIKNESYP